MLFFKPCLTLWPADRDILHLKKSGSIRLCSVHPSEGKFQQGEFGCISCNPGEPDAGLYRYPVRKIERIVASDGTVRSACLQTCYLIGIAFVVIGDTFPILIPGARFLTQYGCSQTGSRIVLDYYVDICRSTGAYALLECECYIRIIEAVIYLYWNRL